MVNGREIIEWNTEDLAGAERFFRRITKSDTSDPGFAKSIRAARELVAQNVSVKSVFARFRIEERDDASVTVGGGLRLTGTLPVKALEQADELYAFVTTVSGFENAKSTDMLVSYYVDAWGSALTECAQSELGNMIGRRAEKEGMKRTHMWSPGQHTFDLVNQKTLFSLLHPEDIGCTLTDSLMMVPVKSSSGIIGIVPEDTEFMPKPCDYCPFRKKCPSTDNGCASL